MAAAAGTLSWRPIFIGPGSVFSLIVPSCDNECGERLTPRLQGPMMPHMRPGPRGKLSELLSQNRPEKTRAGDREWEESDPQVLNIISLITLSCLNMRNLISNFRQLG